jgi:plasmid maintenance system killer protein
MKKLIFSVTTLILAMSFSYAQSKYQDALKNAVAALENAKTAKDYQRLSSDFEKLAGDPNTDWLAPYYAAYCNAKIGWLYKDGGDKIEPFAQKAEQHINTAITYIDSATQKKELSEIYAVMSMINRARVFVNPMTYGRQYGPVAYNYIQKSKLANPQNPRAGWLEGWDKFSTPKMYGGDKAKAREILESAMNQLSAEKPAANYPHWGKAEIESLLNQLK